MAGKWPMLPLNTPAAHSQHFLHGFSNVHAEKHCDKKKKVFGLPTYRVYPKSSANFFFFFHKSFIHLCLQSPTASMHRCQRFTQSLKAPRRPSSTGTSFSDVVTAAFTVSSVSCQAAFQVLSILWNRKVPDRSCTAGGCNIATPVLASNSETMSTVWLGAFSWCKIQLSRISFRARRPLLSNCLSISLYN